MNSKRNYRKCISTWSLSNTLLNSLWVTEEIRSGKKFLEANENENTIYQSLWYKMKMILRGRLIVINIYI
jgi:hypothetical protein